MAGVKGRSGGARANSGGRRPGAGRKPKHASEEHRACPISIKTGDQGCFVYVIYEADEPRICKIGVATDVVQRLSSMQVGTWRILKVGYAIHLPSKSVAHAVERQTHQALSALHCRGKWFHVSHDRAASEIETALSQLRAVFAAVDPSRKQP